MKLLIPIVLLISVFFTVNLAQQQQNYRQKAAETVLSPLERDIIGQEQRFSQMHDIDPDMSQQTLDAIIQANENNTSQNTFDEETIHAASLPSITPTLSPRANGCFSIYTSGNYFLTTNVTFSYSTCIYIHDTSNVVLDCQNNKITATGTTLHSIISVSKVTNFTIKNCILDYTQPRKEGHNIPIVIRRSSHGLIQNNTIKAGWVGVGASGNSFITTANNQIEVNPPKGNSAIFFLDGDHNTIQNNSIDGKWDGIDKDTVEDYVGADDGILLLNEQQDIVADNTIKNFYDCGIETVEESKETRISGNYIENVGYCGIGGWYVNSWKGNTVESNTVDGASYIFVYDIYFRNPDHPNTGQQLYFINNTFRNNTFLNKHPRSYVGFSLSVSSMIDFEHNPPGIPTPQVGNNVFANNNFDQTIDGPYIAPAGGYVDGGGNYCKQVVSDTFAPLDCLPVVSYSVAVAHIDDHVNPGDTISFDVAESQNGTRSSDDWGEEFRLVPATAAEVPFQFVKEVFAAPDFSNINQLVDELSCTESPTNHFTCTIPSSQSPGSYKLCAYAYQTLSDGVVASNCSTTITLDGSNNCSLPVIGQFLPGCSVTPTSAPLAAQPTSLEVSINNNSDNDRAFLPGEEVALKAAFGGGSEDCPDVTAAIAFQVDGEDVGEENICQPLTYTLPDILGGHTITATFPGGDGVGKATGSLSFIVSTTASTEEPSTAPTEAPENVTCPYFWQKYCPAQGCVLVTTECTANNLTPTITPTPHPTATPTPYDPSHGGLITGPYPDLVVDPGRFRANVVGGASVQSGGYVPPGKSVSFQAGVINRSTSCIASHISGTTFYTSFSVYKGVAPNLLPTYFYATAPTTPKLCSLEVAGQGVDVLESSQWTVPGLGVYTIRVCADSNANTYTPGGNVFEVDESPNSNCRDFTISSTPTTIPHPTPPLNDQSGIDDFPMTATASCVEGKPQVSLRFDVTGYPFVNIFRTNQSNPNGNDAATMLYLQGDTGTILHSITVIDPIIHPDDTYIDSSNGTTYGYQKLPSDTLYQYSWLNTNYSESTLKENTTYFYSALPNNGLGALLAQGHVAVTTPDCTPDNGQSAPPATPTPVVVSTVPTSVPTPTSGVTPTVPQCSGLSTFCAATNQCQSIFQSCQAPAETPEPSPTPVQKHLVRIELNGQEIYPNNASGIDVNLLEKTVYDLVITYVDSSGTTQTVTRQLAFQKPLSPTLSEPTSTPLITPSISPTSEAPTNEPLSPVINPTLFPQIQPTTAPAVAPFTCSQVTACMADITGDGQVSNTSDGSSSSDTLLASYCLSLFGQQVSYTLNNYPTSSPFLSTFAPTCQKLDFNQDGKIEQEEVSCVTNLVGYSCQQ